MQRASTRSLFAALILGASLPLSVGLAQPPAPPPPPATPQFTDFDSDGKTWVWLRGTPEEVTLSRGAPGQPGTELGKGKWSEAALLGDACWVLSKDGTLHRVPLAGGVPTLVLRGLSNPGGLTSHGEALYWLELSGQEQVSFFVPTSGPRLQLRTRTAAGETKTLGEWPGSASKRCAPGPGDVIGITETAAYVRVLRPATTEFVRFALPSGEAERIAGEVGDHMGVLDGEAFYWTAPSEESAGRARMVRRRTPGGEVQTLTDWLPENGTLVASGGQLWYASPQLYRLPQRFGPSEIRRTLPWSGRYEADGSRIVELGAGAEPRVVAEVP